MSIPHLDTRVIGGQHSLLFGPYAGFSSKFLKHGSLLDLVESIRPGNVKPLISVARDNFDLTEYLVEQVLQSESHRLATLDEYYPEAVPKDWRLQVAGQRVQIIKPDVKRGGLLEFGTELVGAADNSLVALLGASPGASTAAFIAIGVLQKCFGGELTAQAWLPKLKEMIPSYGISLIDDADFTRNIRSETARALKIEDVNAAHTPMQAQGHSAGVR
jgi:malate dehydrogenase (quinone)